MPIRAILLAAALLLPICGAAHAATVSSHDPTSAVSALQNAGYKAKLQKGRDGDPYIESASSGTEIRLAFMGCTAGKDCDQIEFIAVWDCTNQLSACVQTSAKWNESENFSHTIISGKAIALYYHLLWDGGGMSPELFIRTFEYFAQDMSGLVDLFGTVKPE